MQLFTDKNRKESIKMLEQIIGGDFIETKKAIRMAELAGLTRAEIRREKALYGVKTVQVPKEGEETIWLWFLPEKIWEKYHA